VTGQQAGGSVNDIALEKIAVPVLIFHHKQDSCRITPAYAAERLVKRLTLAPVKKYIEVDGGNDPVGDPCEAFHYHGFIGMEAQAVTQMVHWIKSPIN
jgi:pimeloyl-ACP methyl ester carboxylesterase